MTPENLSEEVSRKVPDTASDKPYRSRGSYPPQEGKDALVKTVIKQEVREPCIATQTQIAAAGP